MFYWVSSLQSYDDDGWNYLDNLKKFVKGGMRNETFIDAVSGIVNRGKWRESDQENYFQQQPTKLAFLRFRLPQPTL